MANSSILTAVSSCICPGHEAVFECTVDDGVTTVWRGSALENCSDGTIILRHSQFDEGHTINETCGTSGPVVGRAISGPDSAENGSHTSQLTISVTEQIIGSLIECAANGEQLNGIQIRLSTGTGILFPMMQQIQVHQRLYNGRSISAALWATDMLLIMAK